MLRSSFGAFDGGCDRSGEARRLGVDAVGLGLQTLDLSLEPRESLASVGHRTHRGHVSLLRLRGDTLVLLEFELGHLQRLGRERDRLGHFGLGECGLLRLAFELFWIGTAGADRGLREVAAAFGCDPIGRVDTLGERRQPEPRLACRRGSGSDLGEMVRVLGDLGIDGVELCGDLVGASSNLFFDCRVLGHLRASGHQIVCRQPQSCVAEIGLHRLSSAGNLGLPSERFELSPQFGGEVAQTREICLHRVELANGLLFALAVLEDSCRLFDERTTVLRPRFQNRREAPLPDDDVHLAPDTRVGQQLLHVHQPARTPVDLVLARTVAEHPSRDGDLGVFDRQSAVGVVDRQRHLGPTERRPTRRPGEDDVFHLAATQRFRTLLAHHPRQCVDHVRLTRAVGAHHAGDAGLESQSRGRREGLEALQGQAFQVHDR